MDNLGPLRRGVLLHDPLRSITAEAVMCPE